MSEEEIKDLIQPYNPNVKNGVWYVTYGTRDCGKSYATSVIEDLQQENEQLKERIEKAIEYIENENLRIVDISKEIHELCELELLSILKGEEINE